MNPDFAYTNKDCTPWFNNLACPSREGVYEVEYRIVSSGWITGYSYWNRALGWHTISRESPALALKTSRYFGCIGMHIEIAVWRGLAFNPAARLR